MGGGSVLCKCVLITFFAVYHLRLPNRKGSSIIFSRKMLSLKHLLLIDCDSVCAKCLWGFSRVLPFYCLAATLFLISVVSLTVKPESQLLGAEADPSKYALGKKGMNHISALDVAKLIKRYAGDY